jgi:hypothetical protein
MTTFTTFIEERLASLRKKFTAGYIQSSHPLLLHDELMDEFTTTAHGAVEAFAEEVMKQIESKKRNIEYPKGFNAIDTDSASRIVPNKNYNIALDDSRSIITELLNNKKK